MSQPPFELSVSRFIDAPPATVWQVMIERLPEWWCPKPWVTEVIDLDWRAGGRAALAMCGPDGERELTEGVVLEFTPGVLFVFTDALTVDWQQRDAFMIGLFEISAQGQGTRYTASARHWNEAAMKRHEEMGFVEGWTVVAEQLAALAEA